MFFFSLGRPVKQNHDINATFSDVQEPGLYILKLFSKSGYKKVYVMVKNFTPIYLKSIYFFDFNRVGPPQICIFLCIIMHILNFLEFF